MRGLARVWAPVALFVALCVGGAAAYVALAPKRYRATAEVLVTPIGDARYAGLPVLHGAHAMETAAKEATTSTLADAVRQRLGLRESPGDLLAHVRAHAA